MEAYIDLYERKCILTVRETANYLSTSVSTVYRLIESGKLHAIRIRDSYRIKASELNDYLNKQNTNR